MNNHLKYILALFLSIYLYSCNQNIDTKSINMEIKPSVKSVKHAANNIVARSLGGKVVIYYCEVNNFDTIKEQLINANKRVLKQIDQLFTDSLELPDSLDIIHRYNYFKETERFYNSFSGFQVIEYYYKNSDTLLKKYLWIDNSLSLISYSYDYFMSPIYVNDSIIDYVDSNRFIILHESIWGNAIPSTPAHKRITNKVH